MATQKTNLHSLLAELRDHGFELGLTDEVYRIVIRSGLRPKNLALAAVAVDLLMDEHPTTLRGLFYRVVSAGLLPSTDKKHSARLGRVMTRLRAERVRNERKRLLALVEDEGGNGDRTG